MTRKNHFWLGLYALLLASLWIPPLGWTQDPSASAEPAILNLHYYWAANCPHCAEAKPFLEKLTTTYPRLRLIEYEVWSNREHFNRLVALAEHSGSGTVSTPAIHIDDRLWFGFSAETAREVEAFVAQRLGSEVLAATASPGKEYAVRLPLLGEVDGESHSLLLITLVLALLDSFNPCAFFVLFFLLSMLVHAHSRQWMLVVGGTFVFCSGFIYFLFMAAWLNLFLLAGHLPWITVTAGLVALGVAVINIKDFFWFKKGVSLSIPEEAKPKLFARMRSLLGQRRLGPVLAGTLVLAVAANAYELLCTAGFPMVYTRLLTLRLLTTWQYYGYLAFYNLVYILPLLTITLAFTWTLGSRKLSQWEGRVLKLLSGVMMLLLGGVLLLHPAWLNNPAAAGGMLAMAIGSTAVVVVVYRRLYPQGKND
ncbi:thioredoxin family protein [Desulfuromonas sp. AOP6]|uniref:thioredoxin family protein n=1 Tax=Desulfuromonas sp. AOP6 TaxID=1566351 RepID=UPI00128A0A4B|nr:thioredoxin family protein [Desulfuromonas sp. AOP6]BCA80804.1 membrane protein [Desulfuromonas sp. AOP6]